ncbi:hypothetical protein QBC34DRAFT_430544 [Podospora aff. communis PSN243]|uniref:Uncharacterized protein n=1 Tax=Podospora aff. communis PSN243 TaxID=3040156 RepID=A0AAV9G850_9PEZI|nr:hypothetical protein QBC34DRAFT_430544 [Podospora aff. communis PSN243]
MALPARVGSGLLTSLFLGLAPAENRQEVVWEAVERNDKGAPRAKPQDQPKGPRQTVSLQSLGQSAPAAPPRLAVWGRNNQGSYHLTAARSAHANASASRPRGTPVRTPVGQLRRPMPALAIHELWGGTAFPIRAQPIRLPWAAQRCNSVSQAGDTEHRAASRQPARPTSPRHGRRAAAPSP